MTHPLTFVILSSAFDILAEVGQVLNQKAQVRVLSVKTETADLVAEVVRLRPSAAIVSFGPTADEELAVIKRLAIECPQTMIIGAARDVSPDMILSSWHAGAHEFLRLPIIASEFEAILDTLAGFAAKQAQTLRRHGRVIAVFSNKGGCGTSFIASNLAVALRAPTALVDLDLQGGNVGFFFQIEPKFSITDLIENRTRMDDELLAKFLAPYSPNLALLPAPNDVDAAVDVKAEHVLEALELLRERYEYVVIDLAHTFDAITLAALDQADEILLVLTLDVMTVRSALRALSVFDRLDYPIQKVRAVVNRWTKNDLDLGRRQVEQLFGNRLIHLVPNDYRATVNSINLGQPLVESRPTSPISVEVRRLAASLGGVTDGKVKRRLDKKSPGLPAPDTSASNGAADGTVAPKGGTNGNEHNAKATRTWTRQIRALFRPA